MDLAVFIKYKTFRQFMRQTYETQKSFLDNYEKLKDEMSSVLSQYSKEQLELLELLYVCNLDLLEVEKIIFETENAVETSNVNAEEALKRGILSLDEKLDPLDLLEAKLEADELIKVDVENNSSSRSRKRQRNDDVKYEDDFIDDEDVESDEDDDYKEEIDDSKSSTSSVHQKANRFNTSKYRRTKSGRYVCDECGKDFARSQNVDLHKTKRLCDPSQKVERDDYEDDGFVSEVALRTMTPYEKDEEGRYKCNADGCEKTFPRAKTIIKHKNTRSCPNYGYNKFECHFCNAELESYDLFIEHKKSEHPGNYKNKERFELAAQGLIYKKKSKKGAKSVKSENTKSKKFIPYQKTEDGKYLCNGCTKTFKIPVDIPKHKNSPSCPNYGNNKFECFYCVIVLDNYDLYLDHKKSEHPDRVKVFKSYSNPTVNCDHCDKKISAGQIKRHVEFVHYKMNRIPCPECGVMISERNLENHRLIHKKDTAEKIMCDKCDYTTIIKERLLTHFKLVHGPKNFSCESCGKVFGTKYSLRAHINYVHNELKCDQCDYTTNNTSSMEKHKVARHIDTVKLVCSFCPFETRDNNDLQNHLMTLHGGEVNFPKPAKKPTRNYDCDMCDHRANGKNALRLHRETKHLGIRYNCEFEDCDYQAVTRGLLKVHVDRIHLKIKFPCKFCDFVAANRNSCRQHMLNKHQDVYELYSCHLCNYRTEHKDLLQRHLTGKYGKHNL